MQALNLHVQGLFFCSIYEYGKEINNPQELFLTAEKKNLFVDFFIKWRISNTTEYYRSTGGDELVAAQRLLENVKDGIRCNAILPGTVETPSWEGRVNMADDPVKARSDFIARQAMGRLAQPEEIASLATYLASDESDFVTGTLNLIDGGWTL